ncbi:unnamed protein product, partial [Urochloa humidicola]
QAVKDSHHYFSLTEKVSSQGFRDHTPPQSPRCLAHSFGSPTVTKEVQWLVLTVDVQDKLSVSFFCVY